MPLPNLKATRPAWFAITRESGSSFEGTLRLLFQGAAAEFVVDLKIESFSGAIFASERVPDSRLPARCAERHINPNGTFCIEYAASGLPSTMDGARVWWGLLHEFMRYQRIAGRTGRWPVDAFISHADAGPHHLVARDAALLIGIPELYRDLLRGIPCWINDNSIKLAKDGSRLINGRAACPVGCKRRNRPRLRRECCKKGAVLTLMKEERLRKQKEMEFWQDLINQGVTCCATTQSCPLAKAGSCASPSSCAGHSGRKVTINNNDKSVA